MILRAALTFVSVGLLLVVKGEPPSEWTPIFPERFPVAAEPGLPGIDSSLSFGINSGSSAASHPGSGRASDAAIGRWHDALVPADTCALHKASMTQDLYFQYIQYKTVLPDLREFTLCLWQKFYNHSNDHPLFSYAIRDTPRAILSWISSTDRSTYYSMSVDGHTLYRLNYPLRLNRWYHSCQSWNGRTGEWQVWINKERVGRGFHNLLVGHVIKGGGVAITGQEQRHFGGGFLEGNGAPKGAGGMLGEVTLLQMYSVALTAGKAYRDHKHHHGHHHPEHDQPRRASTTPAPETTTMNLYAPFLTNGQLTPSLPVFELSAHRNNIPMASSGNPENGANTGGTAVSFLHLDTSGRLGRLPPPPPSLVDDGLQTQHFLFKRDDNSTQATAATKVKREAKEETKTEATVPTPEKEAQSQDMEKDPPKKRAAVSLVGGHLELGNTDGSVLSRGVSNEGLLAYGDALRIFGTPSGASLPSLRPHLISTPLLDFNQQHLLQLPAKHSDKQTPPLKKEDEPAEGEVAAVMAMCSGCAQDPFEKVNIISWQGTSKKLYSGVLYLPARPECKKF